MSILQDLNDASTAVRALPTLLIASRKIRGEESPTNAPQGRQSNGAIPQGIARGRRLRDYLLTRTQRQEIEERQETEQQIDRAIAELRRSGEGAARWLKRQGEDPRLLLRWIDELWLARAGRRDWRTMTGFARVYPVMELFRAAQLEMEITPIDPFPPRMDSSIRPAWTRNTRQLTIDGQTVMIAKREAPTLFGILDLLQAACWPADGVSVPKSGLGSIKDGVDTLNLKLMTTRLRILRLEGDRRISWTIAPS